MEVLLKLAWTKHTRAPFLLSSCLPLLALHTCFSRGQFFCAQNLLTCPFSSRACLPGPFHSLKPACLCHLTQAPPPKLHQVGGQNLTCILAGLALNSQGWGCRWLLSLHSISHPDSCFLTVHLAGEEKLKSKLCLL